MVDQAFAVSNNYFKKNKKNKNKHYHLLATVLHVGLFGKFQL